MSDVKIWIVDEVAFTSLRQAEISAETLVRLEKRKIDILLFQIPITECRKVRSFGGQFQKEPEETSQHK